LKFSGKKELNISRNIIKWIPGLLISSIAIFALLKFIRIGDSYQILRKINPLFILFVIAFTILFLIVRAFGWKSLLGKKATYLETFLKLGEGYFINNIFPLRLGEISRAVFMGVSMDVNPGQVLSTIVIERVFDLLILAVSLLIMLPYAFGMDWAGSIAWVILIVMLMGLAGLFWLSKNHLFVKRHLLKFGNRFGFFKRNILPFVISILDGFQALKSPNQLIFGFLGVLGSWLVSFVQFSLFLSFMVEHVQLWWGAFANTILAMGIALPSAPAGLGIFESSIVAALNLFGVDEAVALAYALIMHFVQFVVTAIIGLYALFRDGYSIKGLFSKLVKQQQLGADNNYSGAGNE